MEKILTFSEVLFNEFPGMGPDYILDIMRENKLIGPENKPLPHAINDGYLVAGYCLFVDNDIYFNLTEKGVKYLNELEYEYTYEAIIGVKRT